MRPVVVGIGAGQDAVGARPFLSFLTTAYQSEDTLPATIASVLAQTNPDWELVVVDNGASEAIAAVVEPHLADPRVQLVRHENRGSMGGVISAAEVATGRHLAVLNSDDTISPDFAAVMARAVERYPNASAITCDAVVVSAKDGHTIARSYLHSAGWKGRIDPERPLRLADVIDGPCPYYTAAIRREVWDEMGGMASVTQRIGDLSFWLRSIVAGHEIRTLPDRLARYSISAGSVSRPVEALERQRHSEELRAELTRAAVSTGRVEDLTALVRVSRRLVYHSSIELARHELVNGDTDEALSHVRRAYEARRTLRAAVLLAGLHASPALLTRVHPVKQSVQHRVGEGIEKIRRAYQRPAH